MRVYSSSLGSVHFSIEEDTGAVSYLGDISIDCTEDVLVLKVIVSIKVI